jgi:hypothetical protein
LHPFNNGREVVFSGLPDLGVIKVPLTHPETVIVTDTAIPIRTHLCGELF